jgi:hypothetical protein
MILLKRRNRARLTGSGTNWNEKAELTSIMECATRAVEIDLTRALSPTSSSRPVSGDANRWLNLACNTIRIGLPCLLAH